ncbi:VOC family protein [Rhizomonospora bruguierae]|uniref:VOC family protein n=1 Tax=Rhizomonospora bruguierae TaxID=1581705 RepID=UPI001BD0CE6B|nr:VOC family protein [Micromonospora sp. NBRC 107566]
MLRCSHVICKVDDVRSLVRDYEDLGFTMEWGSAPERARNAFIRFADGPFLEFFELTAAARRWRRPVGLLFGAAAGDRLAHWAQPGQGCRDLALETEATSLADTRAALRSAGVDTSRVIKGRRTRPDGRAVRYEYLATRPAGMPLVVSAYDPPQRPASIVHPNGARGIGRVRFAVADAARPAMAILIDNDPYLTVVPAATTEVLGVELAGLRTDLDPAKLHGAVLSPATTSKREGTS